MGTERARDIKREEKGGRERQWGGERGQEEGRDSGTGREGGKSKRSKVDPQKKTQTILNKVTYFGFFG